jgi:hypothetical protein
MVLFAIDLEMDKDDAKKQFKDMFDVFAEFPICKDAGYTDWILFENWEDFTQWVLEENIDPVCAVIDVEKKTFTLYNIEPTITSEVIFEYKGKAPVKAAKK